MSPSIDRRKSAIDIGGAVRCVEEAVIQPYSSCKCKTPGDVPGVQKIDESALGTSPPGREIVAPGQPGTSLHCR